MTMKYERYADGEVYGRDGEYAAWFYRQPNKTWKWELSSDNDPRFYEASYHDYLGLTDCKSQVADVISRMRDAKQLITK